MSKALLIDGDGIVYRCGFACEKTKYLVEFPENLFVEVSTSKEANQKLDDNLGVGRIWSRKELGSLEDCLATVKIVIEKIKARFPDYEDVRIIISNDKPTFRHRLATLASYKGTRSKDKPTYYGEIRKYLEDKHGASFAGPGLESDDSISMCSLAFGGQSVCVSLDKDLDQIPGLHYNWVKEETYEISKRQACLNLYSQILSGDPTDNIRGLEGIGPVKAHKMLENCTGIRDCWETVLSAYKREFGDSGEANAIETARLCYLLKKEGEVWRPPE